MLVKMLWQDKCQNTISKYLDKNNKIWHPIIMITWLNYMIINSYDLEYFSIRSPLNLFLNKFKVFELRFFVCIEFQIKGLWYVIDWYEMWVLTSGGWNFAAFLVEYEWTVKFKVNYFNKEVEDFYDIGSRRF